MQSMPYWACYERILSLGHLVAPERKAVTLRKVME